MQSDPPEIQKKSSGLQGWRGLLPLVLVALLAQLSQAKDLFGDLTRPVILAVLNGLGIVASDQGSVLSIGRLEVPWSRDCAGLNLLIILLAVAIWVNRRESPGIAYWVRLAAMIPAALLANVARIFTIIAYRHFLYPQIESPQLHYFFGLLWLVPFAILAMPKEARPRSALIFELLHTASVVALLSPMVDGPGGIALSIAVVFSLSHCHLPAKISPVRMGLFAVWLGAAAAIIWAGVESFWMPWLLVCPLLADHAWMLRPTGAVLILASHPMFALIPGGEAIAWIAICVAGWKQFSHEEPVSVPTGAAATARGGLLCLVIGAVVFVAPFLSSSLSEGEAEKILPPEDLLKKEIPGAGF
ncbi:MAG: exosortase/archaeosortase family protein, partial [Terrimicrobiaceae bacterium]